MAEVNRQVDTIFISLPFQAMNFSPDKSSAKAKKRIRKDVLLKSVLEAASDDAQEIEEGPLIPKVSRSLSRSIANRSYFWLLVDFRYYLFSTVLSGGTHI